MLMENNIEHQKQNNQQTQSKPPKVQIIAGRQPVIEALKAGTLIEKIVILLGVRGSKIEKIKSLAKQNRVPVVEVGKYKFRNLVNDTTTQGVVAIIGSKKYIEVSDIFKNAKDKQENPFILILDEIQDPHNLGALIRTAECAGVHGVIITRHHSASVNQTVAKTSAGASEHMLVAKVGNLVQCIDELKQRGLWIIGTESGAEKNYSQVDFSGPVAIVIGNEGTGIRRLVKERCDFIVSIPLYGKISSLNASVAGALIMYEVVRQRRWLKTPPQAT